MIYRPFTKNQIKFIKNYERGNMAKVKYPVYKQVLWRFARVWLSAFLVSIALTAKDVNNLDNLWPLVLYPALIAGISALGKALRENLGEGDYTNKVYKLPL